MTEAVQSNQLLARRMWIWALVILVGGWLASMFFPNLAGAFEPDTQEARRYLSPFAWLITQLSLPLSASLFVGSIVVRRLPEQACGIVHESGEC